MQKCLLFLFFISAGPLAAMTQPSVQVEVSAGDNYGWQGPGWYYGHYFYSEADYVAWMEGTPPYYGGSYQTTVWIGPGWYGGYWYGNRRDWDNHYHYNSYNRYYNRGDHHGGHGHHGGEGGHHGDGGRH